MIKASELRNKEFGVLEMELHSLLKEKLKLHIQRSVGEPPKAQSFKIVRRNIARIKTVMHEKGKKK
jgi:large subunit ribosomal protein L29